MAFSDGSELILRKELDTEKIFPKEMITQLPCERGLKALDKEAGFRESLFNGFGVNGVFIAELAVNCTAYSGKEVISHKGNPFVRCLKTTIHNLRKKYNS